jgi:dihydrofolate reductase
MGQADKYMDFSANRSVHFVRDDRLELQADREVVVGPGGGDGPGAIGRKLWETMSSHWPTADQQPGATPAQIEFARRWRDLPKVVFSRTASAVDWNARLVTGDAVTEITRPKTENGGPMDIGGATLAAAAMRAGLIDEYAMVTHPVLVGGGTPFFTALDNWVNLNLGGDPGVSRRPGADQVRDQALNTRPRIGAGSGHPRISWPLGDRLTAHAKLAAPADATRPRRTVPGRDTINKIVRDGVRP